jgi:hypothetical protein
MEKGVWIVFVDYGYDGKHVKRVFDREYDAQLYADGAEAVHTKMVTEYWPIYQHGPQPTESNEG